MASEEILRRFENLKVWKRSGEIAPHKPLLVLYALGRWQRGLTDVDGNGDGRERGRS